MENYTTDLFLGGRFRLKQPKNGYRATSDSVLLSAAVPVQSGDTVLDVGGGSGVIGFCLKSRCPDVHVTQLELQPELCHLAEENALLNQMPVHVIHGDVQLPVPALHGVQFHHVVTNPPFYTENICRTNHQSALAFVQNFKLEVWLNFCLKHLRAKGVFCMIHRTEALPFILPLLANKLGALEVFPIEPMAGVQSKRMIVRGILGSKKPFILRPALVMHEANGKRTVLAEEILRQGVSLPLA